MRKPEIQIWFDRALAAEDMYDYDLAIDYLNQVLGAAPADAEACMKRGVIYSKKRNYDQAITDFTDALRANPRLAAAFFNRAVVYGHQDRSERELNDYTQALTIDPLFGEAHDGRGEAYYRRHDFTRAMADFNNAVRAFAEKKEYDQAWKVVSKVQKLGWSMDRRLLAELASRSGRRG